MALFTYVKKPEKHKIIEWSAAQYEELQLHAIATLSSVAPLLIEEYMLCQGNARILAFLEWCESEGKWPFKIPVKILIYIFQLNSQYIHRKKDKIKAKRNENINLSSCDLDIFACFKEKNLRFHSKLDTSKCHNYI